MTQGAQDGAEGVGVGDREEEEEDKLGKTQPSGAVERLWKS